MRHVLIKVNYFTLRAKKFTLKVKHWSKHF